MRCLELLSCKALLGLRSACWTSSFLPLVNFDTCFAAFFAAYSLSLLTLLSSFFCARRSARSTLDSECARGELPASAALAEPELRMYLSLPFDLSNLGLPPVPFPSPFPLPLGSQCLYPHSSPFLQFPATQNEQIAGRLYGHFFMFAHSSVFMNL